MRAPLLALCSVVALAGVTSGVASADDAFHPVPAAPGQTGRLDLRVVSYGHSVHGEIVMGRRIGSGWGHRIGSHAGRRIGSRAGRRIGSRWSP